MTLRILHVGKYYPPVTGGIERFLGDLLPAIEKQGVKAAALVHEDVRRKMRPAYRENQVLFRVPCYGTLLYMPVSPGFIIEMRKAIRSFRPHILHFHVPNTSAFWAMLLPEARALPWVIHWHSDVVASNIDRRMSLAYRLYQPIEKYFLKQAAAVVATSKSYLNTSRPLADFRDKCHIVPLGLDTDRLKYPDESGYRHAENRWGQPTGRVLAIGRLTYYKGHDVLIEAAAALPNARILIAGNGEKRAVLKKQISELGLSRRVTLLGFLQETDLHALIATCNCLCLPSIERTEAFGMVLLEAMRYGKPVVASDIPGSGIGWVVEEGKTGFLVEPRDSRQLSDVLRELLNSPGLQLQMGKAASERFKTVFQIDRVARNIILLYYQI